MELYNTLIKESNAFFEGAASQKWDYTGKNKWKDIGSSELILQKDAAFELGSSNHGSANYVLYTSSPELVEKDEIVLYGQDLTKLKGDCDFARIVLVRIGVIDGDDEKVYRTLKNIEFSKYHVYPDGYMIRMSPESSREQVRVSKQALRRGISFRNLGESYIAEYKKDVNVVAVKVIFTTLPGLDYKAMQNMAKKSTAVTETLTHIFEGLPTDCSVCSLKGICDEVEGMKELHFGVGAKGAGSHD